MYYNIVEQLRGVAETADLSIYFAELLRIAASEIERLREIEWMYNELCD